MVSSWRHTQCVFYLDVGQCRHSETTGKWSMGVGAGNVLEDTGEEVCNPQMLLLSGNWRYRMDLWVELTPSYLGYRLEQTSQEVRLYLGQVLGEGVVTEGGCRPGSSPRERELDLEAREGQ
ncbi:unnamed protein product [Rangifer tarandus platyrhynchus]|uniref:Uncharacterized protein n=2 Tax=Rangifer tarandus platyrhynchus TaxID=3082113 RepID=A0ACB0EET7_RANTA|nr:unnamed protein product [Rangifer tarandus platyrhynchus]CAI9698967.1 unnamed protein product [Rangifer tarandus platyrhynchus]